MKFLVKQWQEIEKKTHVTPAPALLYYDVSIGQKVLRDLVNEKTSKDSCGQSSRLYEELRSFAEKFVPDSLGLLSLYQSERPLFDQYNLEAEIQDSPEPAREFEIRRLFDS